MEPVIEVIEGREYRVLSSDGNHYYTVIYAGSGDADPDYVSVWKCSCPSRITCRHIRAVRDYIDKKEDEKFSHAEE